MEKLKVTPQIIVNVIELIKDDEDERDEDNRNMALHILNSLDWNFESQIHRSYIILVWFGHFGAFAEENDPTFNIETSFGRNVVRNFGLFPYSLVDLPDEEQPVENTLMLNSYIRKAKYFYKKYMNNHDKKLINSGLNVLKRWNH